MIKEKIELNIGYPLRQFTPWYSQLLAIASIDKNFEEWVYCSNINLVLKQVNVDQYYNGTYIFFEDIPECIELKSIPYKIFRSCWKDIILFFKEALGLGYYILIDVDPYYLPCFYKYYKKLHSYNTIIIYGYRKEDFEIAIFDDYPNYHYEKYTCPYSKMRESLHYDILEDKIPFWLEKFNLVYYREEILKFSADKLKAQLKMFIKEKNNASESNIVARGEGVFDKLCDDAFKESSAWGCIVDSLLEYHRIIIRRYDYIIKKNLITENKDMKELIHVNVALFDRVKKFLEKCQISDIKKISENIKIINNYLLCNL